jgi:hypothetical protein
MLKGIKDHLAARLQRQLIEIAVRTLYSEEFDFDSILSRLSKSRDGIHLLRASVAIEVASRLTEPLSDEDTKRAQRLVEVVEATSDRELFDEMVSTRRELAQLYWGSATLNILRTKLAHKREEDSFDGTMYSISKDRKGPVPPDQRASFEKICRQLEEARKDVEIAELEALQEQDPEEYVRYKGELDAYEIQLEIDSLEEDEADLDLKEGIAHLEDKFSELISQR